MMQHYLETKKKYPGCILFYRLGDFYEMFFEDATTVARELEITLTGKDCGLENRAPMCGVPHHAVDTYLNRLIQKGYKVAIAEQMEDPRQAKGLVKREVIRVVTPGTVTSESALDDTKNNYLCCVFYSGQVFGISFVDVSTGDFFMTEADTVKTFVDELYKFTPAEIICNDSLLMSGISVERLKEQLSLILSPIDTGYFHEENGSRCLKEHFHVNQLNGLGALDFPYGITASGALLQYLYDTQKNSLVHITSLRSYQTGKYMILDTSTRRNLELTETLREKQKKGSLLWVLDKTRTAMGARLLRTCIEQPLIDKKAILRRQDAIEELNQDYITREELGEYLNPIYDLERLTGRITYKTANPRDFIAFLTSLSMLPSLKELLKNARCEELREICERMDPLEDLADLIRRSIEEDPPVQIREGGIIRGGFSEEVDKLRMAKTEGKNWLAELEANERARTGIKNLRVKFNKVFGYYLEVSNSFLGMVPDDYTRRQTLTNGERFITPRLKELEDLILGAEDKLYSLEYELFCQIRERVAAEAARIQNTAKAVAWLDVYVSLARVAEKNRYVRPKINEKGLLDIKDGRHPVVELMLRDDLFIANDTCLDNGNHRISIITGPNMAGKSTYMRQAALIVLMAQLGSFVPASSANIGICDRIFTRVGASDDLASGQSTFMVEMTEVANILRNATRNSLLILDEIGRGTSTFDGLSIAWAVVEYISNPKVLGAKTLFATHYHELTELEGTLNGVNNYCIAVKEYGDDIVFLRKIIRGGADKSYGIQVAKLAGIPDEVIRRAKELAEELSSADITVRSREEALMTLPAGKNPQKPDEVDLKQMTLFDTAKDDDIVREIGEMELGRMTPIDALNALYRIQAKLKNRWQ
ncbi:MAG: DNA mismatch repair protein MutS [Lachnospiraceae bacterium]|nr:DNA mismatch repair protein MutS [Lachnospiraceae bacterium]